VLALDAMASEVPVDAPWDAPQARAWDSQTFETWAEANLSTEGARLLLQAAANAIWGADTVMFVFDDEGVSERAQRRIADVLKGREEIPEGSQHRSSNSHGG
jgi:hypothetical protein